MMESRDPAIKLFGMKIPFPAAFESEVEVEEEEEMEMEMEWSGGEDISLDEEVTEEQETPKLSDNNSPNNSDNSKSKAGDESITISTDQIETNDSLEKQHQQQEEEATGTVTDGKTLKKPTKILSCPRCKSMDTKFCYYNNYNINQPRHFCKACQRYWTAGGTMRNVPVGAGRRKNKNSSSHYRHITISEALEAARLDPGIQTNSRVLCFNVDTQQQQQQAAPKQKVSNGFIEQHRLVTNADDCSSNSSITTSNNHSIDESRTQNCRVLEPPQINNGFACIPGVPWPYTWNPTMPPPPGFYPPPGYPMPFYPYWTIPMLSSPQSSQKGSTPNSPTLGKHMRDDESAKTENDTQRKQRNGTTNGTVLVPKTLRIDDPSEAAKSSIWTTLGIKNEMMSKGGMFKGFDEKTKKNSHEKTENSPVLSANPAALSRSVNFHERI